MDGTERAVKDAKGRTAGEIAADKSAGDADPDDEDVHEEEEISQQENNEVPQVRRGTQRDVCGEEKHHVNRPASRAARAAHFRITEEVNRSNWTSAETRCLIGLGNCDRVQSKMETFRKKEAFGDIAEGMKQEGYNRTSKQVQKKIRDLKYSYRRIRNSNSRSGRSEFTTCDTARRRPPQLRREAGAAAPEVSTRDKVFDPVLVQFYEEKGMTVMRKDHPLVQQAAKQTGKTEDQNFISNYSESKRRLLTDEKAAGKSGITGDISIPLEIQLRGPEMQQLYSQARREGVHSMHSVRGLVVGQFRSGKTSVVRRLTGEKAVGDEPITHGIEILPSVKTRTWRKAREEPDDFKETMAERLAEHQRNKSRTWSSSQVQEAFEQQINPTGRAEGIGSSTSPQQTQDIPDDVITKAKQRLKSGVTEEQLGTAEHPRISLWDFGGQATYYGSHECFFTYRGIYILVMSLLQKLSDPVPVLDYKASVDNLVTGRGDRTESTLSESNESDTKLFTTLP
ncbi:hypothetical protein Bbelb_306100 [Branchiostoma belcheri]|nr:hypothetical protein Bbelb_306100 [Branchiostoma belcheri]